MEPFLGEIKMVGFNFAPRGYAMCQGQLLPIAQNSALFSLLGTTFGGNGQVTFGLPDYRGRGPVGMGQGPGLSTIVQGEAAGGENVTLLNSNLPPFSLPVTGTVSVAIPASTADGSSQVPDTDSVLAKPLDSAAGAEVSLYGNAADTTLAPFNASLNANAVHSGGGIPLGVRNPYLGTNFIIALEGVFPSRN